MFFEEKINSLSMTQKREHLNNISMNFLHIIYYCVETVKTGKLSHFKNSVRDIEEKKECLKIFFIFKIRTKQLIP